MNGCGRVDCVGDVRGVANVDHFESKRFCCKYQCVFEM